MEATHTHTNKKNDVSKETREDQKKKLGGD
jgi:hypothetical protein